MRPAPQILIAILVFACIGCTSEAWDPMEEQPKPLPYETSQLFPDQRTMRPIPEGTVSREAPRGAIVHLQDRPDGGALVIPAEPALSQQVLDRGEHEFDIVCAACHGVRANGVSVVATKMALRPPPSLLEPSVRQLDSDQLYAVISDGYGMMPPLRAWFSPEDRWAVISYLRALQLAAAVPASKLAPQDLRQLASDGGRP